METDILESKNTNSSSCASQEALDMQVHENFILPLKYYQYHEGDLKKKSVNLFLLFLLTAM